VPLQRLRDSVTLISTFVLYYYYYCNDTVWLQLNTRDMCVDQVFPVEQPEMTSSAAVDDHDLLFAASVCQMQTPEEFVRNFVLGFF